jgi:hypothetical protein
MVSLVASAAMVQNSNTIQTSISMKTKQRKPAVPGLASHEVCQQACNKIECKNVARDMKLSLTLIHKWCSAPPPHGSGLPNPLDRLETFYHCTGDAGLVEWLCARAGGFFVKNPPAQAVSPNLLTAENDMELEQIKFLEAVTAAARKGSISPEEAAKLRTRLERMKSAGESFVAACERGAFRLVALFYPLAWWLCTGEVPELAMAEA